MPSRHAAAERLAQVLAQVSVAAATVPVVSNVTAAPHPAPHVVRDLLVQQVCAPVRWEEAMRYAVAQGCGALPGKALSGMMKRIAPEVEVLSLDEVLQR
jgi:[acyl-carrier-protein] S-malonyltransferase